jgi:predicted RNA-binding protein with PIN domain
VRVLIDGNNLLHAAADEQPDRPPGRAALAAAIAAWAMLYNRRVHIVFDGPEPDDPLRRQIAPRGVSVSFSGPVTADDVLVREIVADTGPRRLLVVSTDRAVAAAARRRGAHVTRADAFWRKLLADLPRPRPAPLEPPHKSSPPSPDVDDWLREWGFNDPAQ